MTPAQIAEAAELLIQASRNRKSMADLPAALRPADMDQAEAVSNAVQAKVIAHVGGWKIGASDATARAKLGLPRPFIGRIDTSRIHTSPARLVFASLMAPKLECEFCFKLARDLPPRGKAYGRDEVLAAVASLHPGIEIPELRIDSGNSLGMFAVIIDQGGAGSYVLGPAAQGWQSADLGKAEAVLRINGEEKARGPGSFAMGNPIDSLAWLANARAAAGDGLKAGQIVSTGSCTGILPAKPGDKVEADFGPFGKALVDFLS
ncbi:MAG: hydratase [Alphaproteobacteria bacterium]|nr:hydratase [Alphaproteobacteria bacterium]